MELVVRDDGQLRRIERAIAELERRPRAEQLRKQLLLRALETQRAELKFLHNRGRYDNGPGDRALG
jgi:hypothetical protein